MGGDTPACRPRTEVRRLAPEISGREGNPRPRQRGSAASGSRDQRGRVRPEGVLGSRHRPEQRDSAFPAGTVRAKPRPQQACGLCTDWPFPFWPLAHSRAPAGRCNWPQQLVLFYYFVKGGPPACTGQASGQRQLLHLATLSHDAKSPVLVIASCGRWADTPCGSQQQDARQVWSPPAEEQTETERRS